MYYLCQTFSSLLCMKGNLCLSTRYNGTNLFYLLQIFFSWFRATVITYWKQLSSLFFWFIVSFLFLIYLEKSIYDSPRLRPIVIVYIMHSWNMIKNKFAIRYWLLQIYLIFIQKEMKKFLDDFLWMITYQNYAAITLRAHHTFFIIICWWHKIRFHCQMHFSFTRFFKIIYHIT